MNPQTETPETGQANLPRRAKIAPGSHLNALDQARLYQEQMGLEATKRQMVLRRAELTEARLKGKVKT